MKLYYYKDKIGNFGDDLNVWLWDKLIPGSFDDNDDTLFIGIGTLLNSLLPQDPLKIVFSSGVGYKEPPGAVDDKWDIFCVRGPLSAEVLGIEKKKAITDGAALLRTLPNADLPKRYKVSFVPHHASHRPKWPAVCELLGIHYINPSWSVDRVLSDIKKSERVLAESMHGAIVADIYGVPWIPIKLHTHILEFKWHDWCRSLDLEYRPVVLPPALMKGSKNKYWIRTKYFMITMILQWVALQKTAYLSSRALLDSRVSDLSDQLNRFKSRYLQ